MKKATFREVYKVTEEEIKEIVSKPKKPRTKKVK